MCFHKPPTTRNTRKTFNTTRGQLSFRLSASVAPSQARSNPPPRHLLISNPLFPLLFSLFVYFAYFVVPLRSQSYPVKPSQTSPNRPLNSRPFFFLPVSFSPFRVFRIFRGSTPFAVAPSRTQSNQPATLRSSPNLFSSPLFSLFVSSAYFVVSFPPFLLFSPFPFRGFLLPVVSSPFAVTSLDGPFPCALRCLRAGSRQAESFAQAKDPLNLIQVMLAKGDTLQGIPSLDSVVL